MGSPGEFRRGLHKVIGFAGRWTSGGREWKQKAGEEVCEVVQVSPGPCSVKEDRRDTVGLARGGFLESVVRHELNFQLLFSC